MSGQLSIATAGVNLNEDDGNRWMQGAARADDLALASLISAADTGDTSGSTRRKVVLPRLRTPLTGGTPAIPERLLVPALGTSGAIDVHPAQLIAYEPEPGITADTAYFGAIQLAATMRATMTSAQLTANASGVTRTDLVYATIQSTPSVTMSRKVKSLTTKEVSTETVTLASDPTVTITVLPGTTVAGLPADTATAWNFALCEVDVANGYALGDAVTQGMIRPQWRRGGVGPQATHSVQTKVIGATAGSIAYPTSYTGAVRHHRQSSQYVRRYLVQLTNATTAVLLDDTIDFRGRIVRCTLMLPVTHSESVDAISACGLPDLSDTSPKLFTGPGGAFYSMNSGKVIAWVGLGAGLYPTVGALYLQTTVTAAGCYVFEIEYSDKVDE